MGRGTGDGNSQVTDPAEAFQSLDPVRARPKRGAAGLHLAAEARQHPALHSPMDVPQRVMSSRSSVTRAAIGDRSERVNVTCANSGLPFSRSTTATTPS